MTTESVLVEIAASSDVTGVDHYITYTVEDPAKTCRGQQCVLSGLRHAMKYSVVSSACLIDVGGCSKTVEVVTWTKPTSTFL